MLIFFLSISVCCVGLRDKDRGSVQDSWTQGDYPVISATVSFGMGVDKASVRYMQFVFVLILLKKGKKATYFFFVCL